MSNFSVAYNAGGNIDKVKKILGMEQLDNVDTVEIVKEIGKIGSIQGFAKKTQPYNKMIKIEVPAGVSLIDETITLPEKEVEILALSVTCTGYGELDYYDLWFNGELWFDTWYCSEVKEGLFLGTSTYVYVAPPSSEIRLNFHNMSNTSKTIWVGVRMLVDKDEQSEE